MGKVIFILLLVIFILVPVIIFICSLIRLSTLEKKVAKLESILMDKGTISEDDLNSYENNDGTEEEQLKNITTCPNCGAKLNGDVKMCSYCGAILQ